MKRYPIRVVQPWPGWIVSQELCEVRTHWTGKVTQPCQVGLSGGPCQHCHDGDPLSLEFWLLVQDERARQRPALLKLTPHAVEHSPSLLSRNGTLWGSHLVASRAHCRPNGVMSVVVRWDRDPPALAAPREVLPELLRLWRAAGGRA